MGLFQKKVDTKIFDENVIDTISYSMYTAAYCRSSPLDKKIQKKALSLYGILKNRKKMTLKDVEDGLEVMDALYAAQIGAGDKANAKHYLKQIQEYLQK